MTQDELMTEFEKFFIDNLDTKFQNLLLDYFSGGYQACNAKRQEEMARDKALLRECADIVNTVEDYYLAIVKIGKILCEAGHGNE
jgi:hypothetical protein